MILGIRYFLILFFQALFILFYSIKFLYRFFFYFIVSDFFGGSPFSLTFTISSDFIQFSSQNVNLLDFPQHLLFFSVWTVALHACCTHIRHHCKCSSHILSTNFQRPFSSTSLFVCSTSLFIHPFSELFSFNLFLRSFRHLMEFQSKM